MTQPVLFPAPGKRSDAQIRTDLLVAMTADPDVDPYQYRVAIRGGEVHLRGTTRSEYEKEHLETLARRTRGIREVYNRIDVIPSGAILPRVADGGPENAAWGRSDAELARDVREALLRDTRVNVVGLDVGASDGRVQLRGTTASLASRRRASVVAASFPGVKELRNELALPGGPRSHPRGDDSLRRDVATALALGAAAGSAGVQFAVHDGLVELTGRVASQDEHERVRDVVEALPGVRELRDRLQFD